MGSPEIFESDAIIMRITNSLLVAVGLAGLASATLTPSSTQYSPAVKQNVTEQIHLWQAAINTVNTFVDTVLPFANDPAVVTKMATIAFAAAQEESTSNTILSREVKLDPSGEAAAKALPAGFDVIGPAINDTIYQPQNVERNVEIVNAERCAPPRGKGAISLEGDVLEAAASAVGIVIPPVQTPAACYTSMSRK